MSASSYLFLAYAVLMVRMNDALISSLAAECKNYAECIEHVINSTYVDCEGDLSCEASTISSTNSNEALGDGYIECSGDSACKRSALYSAHQIECLAHQSCYFPDYIIAESDVQCTGDHACYSNSYMSTDVHIKSIDANVFCEGTGACLDAKIEAAANVYCVGSESCSNAQINSDDSVYCDANLACKESTIKALNQVYCSSVQGCNRAVHIAANTVYAYGYSTAYQAHISASTVKAFGYHSIAYATLDSLELAEMTVFSYGFDSGYGATFICRSDSECSLQCKTSGCKNLDFVCLTGSACTVSPKTCTLDNAGELSKGAVCPNWRTSASAEQDEALLAEILSKNQDDENNPAVDSYLYPVARVESAIENELSVDDTMFVRCTEYEECIDSTHVGDGYVFYCSASQACTNSTLASLGSNTAASINCNGKLSCSKSALSGAGDIRCNGYQSCLAGKQISGHDPSSRVECYGAESCALIQANELDAERAISGNEVECHGALSCKLSTIKSASYVQCGGYESCLRGDIVSEQGMISCGGMNSCENTLLNANALNVICSATSSCRDSEIRGNEIIIGGQQSAIWSRVYGARSVEAFGYKALEFATIDSDGVSSMMVKSYGYMAGTRAMITCRSGSQCEVKCESRGCFRLELMCLTGSFCSVTPAECRNYVNDENDNSDKIVNGIDCPIWKQSSSKESDDTLLKHVQRKQRYYQTLFKLQKHNERVVGIRHSHGQNEQFTAMVMENEIGLPRHYHRMHLYIAICVLIVLMVCIPIGCYVYNQVFGDDKDDEHFFFGEDKLENLPLGSRSWPLLMRKRRLFYENEDISE
eukprot:CAMPEP_0197026958 /NCGR_PEP_ID=MMETSP1384-20130603/6958_1 /TAXON_ID=29189 /ORGANISM="Ammonia sp." /LENGTH=821 /DNA_ID=CAMNT_0042455737 /DNA_START=40 /DNA_END=2505 /DNA_ORIENTATION=+